MLSLPVSFMCQIYALSVNILLLNYYKCGVSCLLMRSIAIYTFASAKLFMYIYGRWQVAVF